MALCLIDNFLLQNVYNYVLKGLCDFQVDTTIKARVYRHQSLGNLNLSHIPYCMLLSVIMSDSASTISSVHD